MNRHLIARKDAESWRKSRRRKDANFLSKRRARLRPLAFGLAMLMATTSPLTAFATGTGTTTVGTPSSTLYNTPTAPNLSSVGAGGCAQQYTVAIDNLTDTSNSDNTKSFIAQDVGLGIEIGGETAQAVTDGIEAGTLATEDLVANPSPAAPEAAVAVEEGVIDGGTAADLAGVFTDGGGLATSIAATALSQVAQGDTNQAQALTDYTQGNSSNAGLPNCASEFTGTVSADANINAGQGISADNGAIWLGD